MRRCGCLCSIACARQPNVMSPRGNATSANVGTDVEAHSCLLLDEVYFCVYVYVVCLCVCICGVFVIVIHKHHT